MTPIRGRSAVGERLVAKVPQGHWKTLTFVAALRCDGVCAPCLFNKPINARSFLAYIETFLVPTLRSGDIVVMDNLSSHKGPRVRRAIRKTGAKLIFLPPYSPDLNPIEMAFAKLTAHLRQAASRTLGDLQTAVAAALANFQPAHCQGFFRHAQYVSI